MHEPKTNTNFEENRINSKKVSISRNASIAIQSAKIVNGYGTYIQVFGIIIGVCIGIVGIWLSAQAHNVGYALVGLLIGSLDVAIFAVQGALFRMVSNYVIARLEE